MTISKFLWYFTALQYMVGTGAMAWGLESRCQVWQSHFPASKEQTRSVSTGIVIPQDRVWGHSLCAFDITSSYFVIWVCCVRDSRVLGLLWRMSGWSNAWTSSRTALTWLQILVLLASHKQRFLTHRHTSDDEKSELHFWSTENTAFLNSN